MPQVLGPRGRLAALSVAATLTLGSLVTAVRAEAPTTFTLENGLNVVVIEDHRAPIVAQMLWYRVGSADEPPGHSGIAHFLEHLMFKGTDKFGPGEFDSLIGANGGSHNAATSFDHTVYFQQISADHLEMVMELEADRMRGLRLTEEDVITEREVILEERAQRTESDPGALLSEQMDAAQYLNHPYGIPVIGWRHEMEALSREDALSYYQRFYAPNNAILVIAGDVTPDQVRALAEKYYGPIAPTPDLPERVRPQEPPQLAERRLMLADERVSEPVLSRTYLAPERNPGDQKEAAALTILAALLGGDGQTSILAQKLQFESQVAIYSAAGYSGTSIDDGILSLFLIPAAGVSLADAEAAMDKVIADFLTTGPDPKDLERIRMQVRASDVYDRDNVFARANDYGEALSVGLTIADVEDWDDALAAVTAEDVMAAAAKVLDRRNAVTGWLVQPGSEEEAAQ